MQSVERSQYTVIYQPARALCPYVMHLLLFILLIVPGDTYRILCLFPYPGKSHYMVFEPIIKELAYRGHHLTVVSFFPNPHRNRRDVSLTHLAPINVEIVDLMDHDRTYSGLERYYEHIPGITTLAKSNLALCERIINSEVFDEFARGDGDYDVILVEHFNMDCMLGIVHNYGIPSVGLISSTMLPWTPARAGAPDNPAYVPNTMLPFTEDMSFFERLENMIVLYFYSVWYEFVIWRMEQRILEARLGRRLPRLSDVGRNTSVILVNTHHTLNGVKVVPPSIVEVGGIHIHNRTVRPLPETLQNWVNEAKDGFILFSFGSLIRGSSMPVKRTQAMLKAFSRLPQRVLWKWETGELPNLPENVRVIKWLPQYDLLHHRNCVAFITHGGLLSLTEAVSAAVPMLVIPILGDQFGNAAHARRAGVAEVLRLTDIYEITMYDSLKKVLSKEKRNCARLLSELWSDRPQSPMETAVFHIERTARYGAAAATLTTSSHSRWLNVFQFTLIDIIAFLMLLIVLLTIGIRYVSGLRWRRKEKQS